MNAAQDADDLMRRAMAERRALECSLPADTKPFETAEQAAIAALREAFRNRRATDREIGGIVYSCGTSFGYSAPVVSQSLDSFELRIALPAGSRLAAIYHTHTRLAGDTRQGRFSQADAEQQRAIRVPSYIGTPWDGRIRVLETDTNTSRLPAGREVRQ